MSSKTHEGGLFAGIRVAENPARWISRYGSIVTTVYGVGTVDGVKEKGIAMHVLYFVVSTARPNHPLKTRKDQRDTVRKRRSQHQMKAA